MIEEYWKDLIDSIEKESYIPSDWIGVREEKVINTNIVLELLEKFKNYLGKEK